MVLRCCWTKISVSVVERQTKRREKSWRIEKPSRLRDYFQVSFWKGVKWPRIFTFMDCKPVYTSPLLFVLRHCFPIFQGSGAYILDETKSAGTVESSRVYLLPSSIVCACMYRCFIQGGPFLLLFHLPGSFQVRVSAPVKDAAAAEEVVWSLTFAPLLLLLCIYILLLFPVFFERRGRRKVNTRLCASITIRREKKESLIGTGPSRNGWSAKLIKRFHFSFFFSSFLLLFFGDGGEIHSLPPFFIINLCWEWGTIGLLLV